MQHDEKGVRLTHEEAALIAHLLDSAGGRDGYDFDLGCFFSDISEIMNMVRQFHTWNGDPEELKELAPTNAAMWLDDSCVMHLMAARLTREIE